MMQPVRRSEERYVRGDSGFTMIELIVVMSVASTLMALAVFGFTNYQRTAEHQGTQEQLTSQLRNLSQRAISEGRTYCIALASDSVSYDIWRGSCGTGTHVQGPLLTQDSRVTISATVTVASPTPPCSAGAACIYFYPRGTATPAQLIVSSSARDTTYTIRVEGLTARVY
jgi:prepilin-type N-terminal cleavage/methylation domain-containing protein